MKDEHNLDKLFKEGLDEIDIPFHEPDWAEMSKKLDQQDKKTIFPLWWSLCAAAAASILIFFIFFNTPKNNHTVSRIEKNQPLVAPKNALVDTLIHDDEKKPFIKNQAPIITDQHALANIPDSAIRNLQPVLSKVVIDGEGINSVSLAQLKTDGKLPAGLSIGKLRPSEKELRNSITPNRLSLTVMAAPDISSTSSSVSNKVSTNFGLMINYALTKKIGLSTGVIYAKKIYDYNGFGTSSSGYSAGPWQVNADCKVLDIPVNLNYQVFKKRSLAVNVSAGLSSYIMLNEKYQLTSGPASMVTNEEVTGNKYFMGIANFSVGVERKVNSRLSLGLQPFLKVPLTGIGKYEGNLSSAGISVLFNIKSLSNN
ncbi:hypothetical protein EV200_10737 [Pedobacter psychrotolerans]|uniref:Outer membrane protein beta-barrel domain-containing protein n=1 Tax=Pedobacter psychrotolerans TaxID=1843235 RepID=A0A4V2RYR0_9SPHI|nr:hypothetical protein [Pedobacter psychrotolerans]TCO21446.1 hypothetical protein EV200_10737 [Pedobacter psychrotolerans]GGE38711.1 hypothetical protein GCM10011413_00340 [Pedobacter psychrotolerans]